MFMNTIDNAPFSSMSSTSATVAFRILETAYQKLRLDTQTTDLFSAKTVSFGWLGPDFTYVSLESGWLGQKPWFLIPETLL